MDSTEKTVLIVGGVGVVGILLFSMLKQQAANAASAANQPGLVYQTSVPAQAPSTLDNILSGVTLGSSALGSIFGAISSAGTSNDPGLESGEDDIAYESDPTAYSYAGANSYTGTNGNVTGSSDIDEGIVFDD